METAISKSSTDKHEEPADIDGNGTPVEPANGTAPKEPAASGQVEDKDDPFEVLEPFEDPREWVIGKPPVKGGTPDDYSIYVQRPLGWMQRNRFFALVTKNVAEAMKQGATIEMPDGTIRERMAALRETDITDAGNFMQLAMQVIAYAPDFLLDCYILWLDVPAKERRWARMVMDQPYDPDREQWGLTEEQGIEIIETFIDQNYMSIKELFTGKLPRLLERARQQEKKSEGRQSASAPSKQ